jgi:hypothetical protein
MTLTAPGKLATARRRSRPVHRINVHGSHPWDRRDGNGGCASTVKQAGRFPASGAEQRLKAEVMQSRRVRLPMTPWNF